jgi:hypothetical protein
MKIWRIGTNQRDKDGFGEKQASSFVINQNIVIAWKGLKPNIHKVKKGDLILSYHNDNRIIAVGYAVSEIKDHKDYEEQEYFEADWIWKTDESVSNPILRNEIDMNNARGTVIDMTNGIDIAKLLAEIGKRKVNI